MRLHLERTAARLRAVALGLGASCALAGAASADDMDIFALGGGDDDGRTTPSVMIMLDRSGSMGQDDSRLPLHPSRMDRARGELADFVSSTSGIKLGLSSFNGADRGGAILVPARDLDAASCADPDCDRVRLRALVRRGGDDGYEILDRPSSPNGDGRVRLEWNDEQALGQVVRTHTASFPQPLGDEDTVMQYGSAAPVASSRLEAFHSDTPGRPGIGVRFENIVVPDNVVIERVNVSLVWRGQGDLDPEIGEGAGDVLTEVRVDERVNAPEFGTAPGTAVHDRPSTDSVRWTMKRPNNWDRQERAEQTGHVEVVEDPPPRFPLRVISPNIAELVAPVLTRGGPRSLTLMLSPADGAPSDRQHTLKLYGTGEGDRLAPELSIRYRYIEPPRTEYDNAFRFDELQIPPGATIRSAHLEFFSYHGGGASGTEIDVEVAREAGADAAPPGRSAGAISARSLGSLRVPWSIERWRFKDTSPKRSADLSSLVQEGIDEPDWCAGNAMTLRVIPVSGNDRRRIKSFEYKSQHAPALVVEYEPPGPGAPAACRTVAGDEIVAEPAAASIQRTRSGALENPTVLENDRWVALRFDNIALASGTGLGQASLVGSSARKTAGPNPMKLEVGIARAAPGERLAVDAPGVQAALAGEQVAHLVGRREANVRIELADLERLAERVLSGPDWSANDSLVVTLRRSGGAALDLHGVGGSRAPTLRLARQVRGEAARAIPPRTHRDALLERMVAMGTDGNTPVLDAFYETSAYLLGEPVLHGARRGEQQTKLNETHRLSHPGSYEGGTVERPEGCDAADPSDPACVGEIIAGDPVYAPPERSQCGAARVVLVTDGLASSSSEETEARVRALSGTGSCEAAGPGEACATELARWLSAGAGGRGAVSVDTVGFTDGFDTSFLERVADAGGGSFHAAGAAGDLSEALDTIVTAAAVEIATFTNLAVPVSQYNRFVHSDELYFSVFEPAPGIRWPGNLKRYRLGERPDGAGIGLIDEDGRDAFDAQTGTFATDARSGWSTVPDGAVVPAGGAASRLDASRRLLVRDASIPSDRAQSLVALDTSSPVDLVSGPDLGVAADERDAAIRWLGGADETDSDADGDRAEPRRQIGASPHTTPRVVRYPGPGGGIRSVVYAGSQEGLLQAVETERGDELWAYLPPELYRGVGALKSGARGSIHYGLDSPIGTWSIDVDADGVIERADGDRAVLVAGMRRGGRHYHALDVSDPDEPRLLWTLGPDTHDGAYTDLGQSWSTPAATRVRLPGEDAPTRVLVIAGGYDPINDDDAGREARATSRGSLIYLVDPETGEPLATIDEPEMRWSIPSDASLVDADLDGAAEALYVGDVGGNLWAVNLAPGPGVSGGERAPRARLLARLQHDARARDDRRFFHPPETVFVAGANGPRLMLVIGSGRRDDPLDRRVTDRLHALYADADRTLEERDLVDVTDPGRPSGAGAWGWFGDLDAAGEKILGSPRVLDHRVLVTSYVPPGPGVETLGECAPSIGSGRLLVRGLADGAKVFGDLDGDGRADDELGGVLQTPGLPPEVAVLVPASRPSRPVALVGGQTIDPGVEMPEVVQTYWFDR